MKSIRSTWAALLIGIFAIAVLGTGCDDPAPKQEEAVVKDSVGPPPPPPATMNYTTVTPQPGTVSIVVGRDTIHVSLTQYTLTGTVESRYVVGGSSINPQSPIQIQTISPSNPQWPTPCNGITDQPVGIRVGDTTPIRR
ncbi:MAG: hypothetical protein EHM43_05045 [Ignavibacteriae bacterium]|nr:MAG: hypothetical protein EHM43_05045 [Ignavibacteriota bacterium]